MRQWRHCRDKMGVRSDYAIESLDGAAIVCKVLIEGVPRYELRMRSGAGFPAVPTSVHESGDAAKVAAG